VTGAIVADPGAAGAASVEVSIDMRTLDTGVALRNREMRQRYLQTDKFPFATFKSVSVVGPAAIGPNEPADIKVTGDFSLHGVTKRMTIPVRVVVIPDGRIHATALFNVKMPEFGINVPDNVLVTVNNEVPVRLDVWAVRK
jgi:polyisoprenoid-binding protein YceI